MPGSDVARLDVELVDSVARLEALAPAWGELFERCPAATPFQSPEWLLAWWRRWGRGELHTLALWSGGRLVGLAPLYMEEDDTSGAGGRLQLVGAAVSDYLDVLLDPGVAAAGRALLLERLAALGATGRCVELQELPAWSPLLADGAAGEAGAVREEQSVCPVLRLPETWDAYLAALSQGRRRKLRLAGRRLAEAGEVRVELASEVTAHAFLDTLYALHEARWRGRDQPGMLADAGVRSFHREVAPALARRGVLRLHRLTLAETPVAALYGFARGERWYSYLGGFDPALESLSPGTVLMAHALRSAIAERRRAFDFLRGRERYKYAWRAGDERTYRLRLGGTAPESRSSRAAAAGAR